MTGLNSDRLFAYSIRSMDDCWSWRVYDADGRVVAAGETPSKSDAQLAVAHVYNGDRLEPRTGVRNPRLDAH